MQETPRDREFGKPPTGRAISVPSVDGDLLRGLRYAIPLCMGFWVLVFLVLRALF